MSFLPINELRGNEILGHQLVWPASKTATMFGWRSLAATFRFGDESLYFLLSRLQRIAGLLRATARPNTGSFARYTVPNPPLPSTCLSSNRPMVPIDGSPSVADGRTGGASRMLVTASLSSMILSSGPDANESPVLPTNYLNTFLQCGHRTSFMIQSCFARRRLAHDGHVAKSCCCAGSGVKVS